MSPSFNPSEDLSAVADGIETVTLLRRGSTLGVAGTVIAHALRRAMSAAQATVVSRGDVNKMVASGGRHLAATVVWHLPIVELPLSPRLGDVVLDSDGQRWTILEVKRATLGARWRCETKNVAVAFGLDDTISVLKTVASPSSSEPVWRPWRTGIRARVQPIDTKITTSDGTSTTTTRYRIFIEENVELDHTCCIRGPDGTLFTITAAIGADRIGELQVIEAQITQSSSAS